MEREEQSGRDEHGRKLYYVSVQAGQILDDQEAAAYELEIRANEEDISRLRELFEELASMDEAVLTHFGLTPYETNSDSEINAAPDEIIVRIYKQLYECGTERTRRHIESMNLFGTAEDDGPRLH